MKYFVAGVTVWAACAAGAEQSLLFDGVAAHVNEQVITVGQVLAAIEPVQRQLAARYSGDELKAKLQEAFDNALRSLVERRLILDAYQSGDMRVPDWVVERRVNEIIQDVFSGDRSELFTALAEDRLTYEEWRREVAEQIAVVSMRDSRVRQNVAVSPGAVRDYYEQHLDEYRSDPEVNLKMVMIGKSGGSGGGDEPRERAERARSRLLAGEDFAALAREVSEGTHAADGGSWGWVEPKMLRRDLEEALGAVKPGQISEIVETEGEFYILKVEGRKEAALARFEDVQPEIENELRREAAARLYDQWVAGLWKDGYVKIFPLSVFE
ncbi:peptidylprolyl isomerase [Verrucomicrobiota bacterium]